MQNKIKQIQGNLEKLASEAKNVLNDVKGNLNKAQKVCERKQYARAQKLNQEYKCLTGKECNAYTQYGTYSLMIQDEIYELNQRGLN